MPVSETNTGTRVAGAWLAIASLLLLAALAFHGPIAPDLGDQMKSIAAGSTRWAAVHWAAAAALAFFAVAGLVALASGTRLTRDWWTMSAWAVLPIGALSTMTTAVAEATVVASAAASGNAATFEAWWAFSSGKASGFALMALAVAVIAANETRASLATPVWASWIGVVAGSASFIGWVLGMWLGIGFGSLLWIVSSLVMCAWTLWFGWALLRSETGLAQAPLVHRAPLGDDAS